MMAIVGLQVAPLTAILDKSGGAVVNGSGDTASGIDKNSSADPALYLDRISTIFMVSKLTNVAAPLLFMIFGTLISLTLSNVYKLFFTWFSIPP